MQISFSKFEKYALLLSATLFLTLYFILSFNLRLASDDFGFFTMVQNGGFKNSVYTIYMNWSGRWSGIAYYYSLLSVTDNLFTLNSYIFLYYLISISLLVYSVYYILGRILNYFFDTTPSEIILFSYSVLFCAALYFFTFQNIETWFWLCSSFCYLQMIIFTCLGTAIILDDKNSFLFAISHG